LANSNYTLSYVGNNLAVTPRLITVTADAQSRAYGDANPALTYPTARSGGGVGLGNGDSLSGALTTTAGTTSGVGGYAITNNGLANNNYTLTYVGNNLAVTPRLITVTADDQVRDYGMANPALTYRITSGTLVNSDSVSGALTTTAGSLSAIGTYDISRGTLGVSSNYSVNFVNGSLTIRPTALVSSGANAYIVVAFRDDGQLDPMSATNPARAPDISQLTLESLPSAISMMSVMPDDFLPK
jgi:hypothetical protein